MLHNISLCQQNKITLHYDMSSKIIILRYLISQLLQNLQTNTPITTTTTTTTTAIPLAQLTMIHSLRMITLKPTLKGNHI